ncbi:undecaprenyl-diphosphate phosphatase [Bacillus fonticola]|uniref:undecaprenyl-diphosphate phosphatase n=1 Tax=Bacillus fonticola TaxID=2728853 RepID=UPI001474E9EA|nr:undecaprenyl-diphosphate phosphatase [Bacillus fonticola]
MEAFLELLKYTFLGLIQGFTEPIPISSSGHLLLAKYFLGIEITGLSFELLMNTASLFAVLLIYRETLWSLTTNGLHYLRTKDPSVKSDFNFIVYLIIGTIPAGVLGLLFNDWISDNLTSVVTIGITLLITGTFLWLIRNLRGRKQEGDLSMKDAVIVGLAQAVALIPGISRSGATIVASMFLGMKQDTALRFSFLLYIPVSVGGMVLGISDFANDNQLGQLLIPYSLAFIASFIASYYSLRWFMNIMARGNLKYFAMYCFIVGPIVILSYWLFS